MKAVSEMGRFLYLGIMNIDFTLSPVPWTANSLVAVVYYGKEPFEIARYVQTPPHEKPRNYLFTDLPVWRYRIRVYESNDGVNLGNILHSFWYTGIFKLPRIIKMRKAVASDELTIKETV